MLRSTVASACGALPEDACANVNALPKSGGLVPSNVPALAIGGSGAKNVELHDEHGALVATTLQSDPDSPSRQLLIPSAPLAAGKSYELAWPCDGATSTSKSSFSALAPEPMPTTTGTASFEPMFRGDPDMCTGSAAVNPEGSFVFLPVKFTPAPDLGHFASVVTYVWELDGHDAVVSTTTSGPALRMSCATGTESETFHFRIRSIIPGATSQPQPFEVDVRMSCDPASWDVASVVNDNGSDPSSSTSSCAVQAARPARATGLVLTGLGAIGFLVSRRRRRDR